jgi:signal transduction histidine kinase
MISEGYLIRSLPLNPAEAPGLDLSIARSIIQRHKGCIEVESKKMKGTIFSIIFPES